jgi:UPF0042 nucleotide-binding protein
MDELDKRSAVIVTGLSGAGKSVAIKALEDLGFYCIDNLPVGVWDSVANYLVEKITTTRNYAIGTDVRDPNYADRFVAEIEQVRARLKVEVLFLTADDESLLNRFSTTRRRHPLAHPGVDLMDAIKTERSALQPIEQIANTVIDTSNISPHELARKIEANFRDRAPVREMTISFTSFGFQYGVLRSVDSLFDVRFLPNPHYQMKLRQFSGLDAPIQQFLDDSTDVSEFFDLLSKLLEFVIPRYYKEGKHYFRIGIGCTGGKHRSVYLAERMARYTAGKFPQFDVTVSHRDLK